MAVESNIFEKNNLFLKVLGSYLVLSVFDPIIFQGIEKSELLKNNIDGKVILYNLFLIGYSMFPLVILVWYWSIYSYKSLRETHFINKIAKNSFLFILLITIIIFALPSSNFVYFVTVLFILMSIFGIIRLSNWNRPSFNHETNQENKLGLTIIIIIGAINIILNIGSFLNMQFDRNIGYQKKFLDFDHREIFLKNTLIEFYGKDSLVVGINDSITQIQEKTVENDNSSSEKVKKLNGELIDVSLKRNEVLEQIIKINRTKQILASSFILLLLILLFLFLHRFQLKASLHFSLKTLIGIYFFSIITLAKPVNNSLSRTEDIQSLYFVDNWYLPQSISTINKTSINNSRDNSTKNYDSGKTTIYDIKEYYVNKKQETDTIILIESDTSIVSKKDLEELINLVKELPEEIDKASRSD